MRDHAPAGHDDHLIAEDPDFFQNVAREHNAHSRVAHLSERRTKRPDTGDIQSVCRLVEYKILRRVKDGSRERGLHSLALGEPGGTAIRDGLHAELPDHFFDALRKLSTRDTAQLAEVGEVFARREPGIQTNMIQQRADGPVNAN